MLILLIAFKVFFPLSVCVIKLRMGTLLSGKAFSINFFMTSSSTSTSFDGLLIVLLVPICNIKLSGHFLIVADYNCTVIDRSSE